VAGALLSCANACVSEKGCPDGGSRVDGVCAVSDLAPDAGRREHDASSSVDAADPKDGDAGNSGNGGGADAEADAGPCDGGDATTCYDDDDDDDFAAKNASQTISCDGKCPEHSTKRAPSKSNQDCDDSESDAHPGAIETCNNRDDDCDGDTDEDSNASCDAPRATGVCGAGTCDVDLCEDDYGDCDTKWSNGCEQTLDTDNDCGGCDRSCDPLAACESVSDGHDCLCPVPYWYGLDCTGVGPLAGGQKHVCGIRTNGTVVCGGDNASNQSTPLGGTFTQLAAGGGHTCGLRPDTTVECWGLNTDSEATPPSGSFLQIAAGTASTCGIKSNGDVQCWGVSQTNPSASANHGQGLPSPGTFRQISARSAHTCGVRADGTVACWGAGTTVDPECDEFVWPDCGQSDPPSGRFIQVAAGGYHTCGLRPNGRVECWGGSIGKINMPETETFRMITAGSYHTCGLTTDARAVCWGAGVSVTSFPNYGQSAPPAGSYKSLAAGALNTCGVRTDGRLQCWGGNGDTPTGYVFDPDTFPVVP
jgi:alpha-tubulin suppressor-like RCC1 family protein